MSTNIPGITNERINSFFKILDLYSYANKIKKSSDQIRTTENKALQDAINEANLANANGPVVQPVDVSDALLNIELKIQVEVEKLIRQISKELGFDHKLGSTAFGQRSSSQEYFEKVLDVPAFASQDHTRLRNLLLDSYSSLKTLSYKTKNLTDPVTLNTDELNEAIKSLGFPYPGNIISDAAKLNFYLSLIDLYNTKGTAKTLASAIQIFGLRNIIISEWWMHYDAADDEFYARSVPIYPVKFRGNNRYRIQKTYNEFTAGNPFWQLSLTELRNLYESPAHPIKLPSITSVISVNSAVNITKFEAAFALIQRKLKESYEFWLEYQLNPVGGIIDFIHLANQEPTMPVAMTTPPEENADGDAYIVVESVENGDWAGHAHQVATWSEDAQEWIFTNDLVTTYLIGADPVGTNWWNKARQIATWNGTEWEYEIPAVDDSYIIHPDSEDKVNRIAIFEDNGKFALSGFPEKNWVVFNIDTQTHFIWNGNTAAEPKWVDMGFQIPDDAFSLTKSGTLPDEGIRLNSFSGVYNTLEIMLAIGYLFNGDGNPTGSDKFLQYNGLYIPLDVEVNGLRDGRDEFFDHRRYNPILEEWNEMYDQSHRHKFINTNPRDAQTRKWKIYTGRLTEDDPQKGRFEGDLTNYSETHSVYMQNHCDIFLEAINPEFKREIDLLASIDKDLVLENMLLDYEDYLRTYIGVIDAPFAYVLIGGNFLRTKVKPVINFFKPLRARILEFITSFDIDDPVRDSQVEKDDIKWGVDLLFVEDPAYFGYDFGPVTDEILISEEFSIWEDKPLYTWLDEQILEKGKLDVSRTDSLLINLSLNSFSDENSHDTNDLFQIDGVNVGGSYYDDPPIIPVVTLSASFTSGPSLTGFHPLSVNFVSTTTHVNPITNYLWNFGDGNIQDGASSSASHTYVTGGVYTVSLTVTDSLGNTSTRTKSSHINSNTYIEPFADFTADIQVGNAPFLVQFWDWTQNGTGLVIDWSWDFGDGGTEEVYSNPTHTYTVPGTYSVTLTSTDENGHSDTRTKANFIIVSGTHVGPTADFTGFPTYGEIPLDVDFLDASIAGDSAIVSWSWTFGDGNTSTSTNPSNTYTDVGSYTVSLTVTDANSLSDTKTRTNYIISSAIPSDLIDITPTATVKLANAPRFGMNVGYDDKYGASRLLRNIFRNPGFEANEFGTIVHAFSVSGNKFVMNYWDTSWNSEANGNNYGIGWPEDFWTGGTYRFMDNEYHGTILDHYFENGKHVFTLDQSVPNSSYILCLRKNFDGCLADWNGYISSNVDTSNPHTGAQCLKLISPNKFQDYQDSFYRDTEFDADKFLIPNGNWTWNLWARGTGTLNLRFRREGGPNWINQTITLSSSWTQYSYTFACTDTADKPVDWRPLLIIEMIPSATAYIDDVELYPTDNVDPYFFDEVVDRLTELNPGVLRYWGEQLGSSLNTMLATQFNRRMVGWKPHVRTSANWNYSYPEFLHLCQVVGAIPWMVMPPTFTAAEYVSLKAYLDTTPFDKIILEYGNEMWGSGSGSDPFFGASAQYGSNEGMMANKAFSVFASDIKYYCMAGGQYAWVGNNVNIQTNCPNRDAIAVAPYFGSLQAYANDYELFQPLFTKSTFDVTYGYMKDHRAALTGDLAVYEDNFHTTDGATDAIRINYTSCKAGAIAMPLMFLMYARTFGLKYQCAFQLLQFSNNKGRIWGLLRNQTTKRPNFLGLELANMAISGNMVDVTVNNTDGWTQSAINGIGTPTAMKYIQAFGWKRADNKYNFIIMNLSLDTSYDVNINVGHGFDVYGIQNTSIHDHNEGLTPQVTIESIPVVTGLTLRPHSIYAIIAN